MVRPYVRPVLKERRDRNGEGSGGEGGPDLLRDGGYADTGLRVSTSCCVMGLVLMLENVPKMFFRDCLALMALLMLSVESTDFRILWVSCRNAGVSLTLLRMSVKSIVFKIFLLSSTIPASLERKFAYLNQRHK